MQTALIPPIGMVLLCVLPEFLSTGSTAGKWSHLSLQFCELRDGLLLQRKLFGVLTDPRMMLAALQVCEREYPHISSGEAVGFIARAWSDCVWDHVCSSAFRLEKVCRRVIVGNRRRKSMLYLKILKKLFLFSLAKWRLEGIELLSVKMPVGKWEGGSPSLQRWRSGRAFQAKYSDCFQNGAWCDYEKALYVVVPVVNFCHQEVYSSCIPVC